MMVEMITMVMMIHITSYHELKTNNFINLLPLLLIIPLKLFQDPIFYMKTNFKLDIYKNDQ